MLTAAAATAAANYRQFEPGMSEQIAALLAETVVRLALSHLVLPTHPAAEAADMICAAVAPFLAHHSTDQAGYETRGRHNDH